jgi:hypothetical protein
MKTIKKIIAAVLAISSAACVHNFVLSLAADVLVPARSLRRDVIALAFFAVIAIGGAAGAAKLWDRWRIVFGWSAIVTAFGTAQLMMANHSDPAPSAHDKFAAYLTVAVVGAAGALVLIRKHGRLTHD